MQKQNIHCVNAGIKYLRVNVRIKNIHYVNTGIKNIRYVNSGIKNIRYVNTGIKIFAM